MSRGGARECEFEQNERKEEVGKPAKRKKKCTVREHGRVNERRGGGGIGATSLVRGAGAQKKAVDKVTRMDEGGE